jgi:hypothetical protein
MTASPIGHEGQAPFLGLPAVVLTAKPVPSVYEHILARTDRERAWQCCIVQQWRVA